MENDLIYKIGEAILSEVDGVVFVSYPGGKAIKSIYISMNDGKRYEIALKEID